jgi:hypothetical protein
MNRADSPRLALCGSNSPFAPAFLARQTARSGGPPAVIDTNGGDDAGPTRAATVASGLRRC